MTDHVEFALKGKKAEEKGRFCQTHVLPSFGTNSTYTLCDMGRKLSQ